MNVTVVIPTYNESPIMPWRVRFRPHVR